MWNFLLTLFEALLVARQVQSGDGRGGVNGGGLILLCRAVCKRLQKRRPKDQGFGNYLSRKLHSTNILVYLKSPRRRREKI